MMKKTSFPNKKKLNFFPKAAKYVGLVLVLTFFARSVSSMMQSNDPLYARILGANVTELGIVASVYALTTMIVRFGFSARLKLLQVPTAMAIGFVIWALSLALAVFSPTLIWFLIAVSCAGVSTALIMPHLLSLAGSLSSPDQRDKNLSWFSLALSLSLVVAPIGGSVVLTLGTMRALFAMLFFIALIAAGAMLFFRKRLTRHLSQNNSDLSDKSSPAFLSVVHSLIKNGLYMRSIWAQLAFSLAFSVSLSYGGVDARSLFHLNSAEVEMLLVSFFVVSLLGRLIVAKCSGSTSHSCLNRRSWWMFSSLIIGTFGLVLMGWAPNIIVFVLGWWLLAWPHAVMFPLVTMRVASSVEKNELVAANTLMQSSFDLTSIAGPLIIGIIAAQSSIGVGFWVVAVAQLLGIIVLVPDVSKELFKKEQTKITMAEDKLSKTHEKISN